MSFVAPSIGVTLCQIIGLSLKTLPGTMILAEPYFATKSIEHDVTLTSFTAELWFVLTFSLVRMCKIDEPEGTESLVPISLFVWKILRKNDRGGYIAPPSGAG